MLLSDRAHLNSLLTNDENSVPNEAIVSERVATATFRDLEVWSE